MMKLGRLFQSRKEVSGKLLFGSADGFSGASWLHALVSRAGISSARANVTVNGSLTDRIFAEYSIYKGKAALSVNPVLPTFTKINSGSLVVERRGSMMLRFTPAIGERKYDWEKKQHFALSATEVGSLISLGPKDSCEFFHDPSMKSINSGQVRKTLSIKPHADGSGYLISLSVVNNVLKTNDWLTVPVTVAEFEVMKTACRFVLPHIMGWNGYTNQMPRLAEVPSKANPQFRDLEWGR